jgi:GNAT superfamily N-acetyltransferase
VGRFEIRAARIQEAEELSELAFRSKCYWGYDQEFMESCRDDLTYTPAKIASRDYNFQVYENDARVVALYALHHIQTGVAELEAFFVDPPYIGNGIGTRLLEHAKLTANAQGVNRLIIQSDPYAQEFYLLMGARAIGSRESDSIPGRYLPLFELSL